ncbi:MAG: hypothetical protein KCHDKBKB_00375 [Elusimicrobia bacterium]|nr:hypothetical protein [Elusimicrobiota bacterium]
MVFALILLTVHVFLAKPAITTFSPTYDEPVHLTAGWAYLKAGEFRYNGYHHPPFGEMWAALPLLRLNPFLPAHHPAWIKQTWSAHDQYQFADVFFYKNRVPGDKMLFSARWMQVVLSCLLGLWLMGVALWMGGRTVSFLTGIFWALSPTFLSHGTIVSTDLAFAFFFFGYFSCLWRLGHKPFDLLAGVFLGLAFASKYFALSVVPITIVALVLIPSLRKKYSSWIIIFGMSFLVLCLVYQFSGLEVFVEGFSRIFARSQTGRASFFWGEQGTQGWLLYFPALFVLKTPLPLLMASLVAVVQTLRRKMPQGVMLLWIPVIFFFGAACFSKVQIGHRHILAIYPFLFVLAGMGIQSLLGGRVWITLPFFIWMLVQTWAVRPHYLAYFNELIGGPSQGYRYFTDSNVDWGQGLKQLADALTEEEKKEGIFLNYFGVADPHAYGIRYLDVGSEKIVPREDDTARDLSPTTLAISVTQLQGTYYADPTVFSWLKKYEPVKKVAHSIFVYDFSHYPEALEQLRRLRS